MWVTATLRRFLGTDRIEHLEHIMVSAAEQINAVHEQLIDLLQDVAANTDILLSKAGQLDEEGQAALDRLAANVAAADAKIGDADGSDTAEAEVADEEQPPA